MIKHQVFDRNDAAFHDWLTQNPDGFVANLKRNLNSDYCVLHRASCDTISNPRGVPGKFTERQYVKVCANDFEALAAYAAGLTKTPGVPASPDAAPFSKRCGFCKP